MYYRSFRMTQLFLTEIWDRILKDLRLNSEYWTIQAEIHYWEEDGEYKLSEGEVKIIAEYEKHEFRLNLDVEDWFLHAHILIEKYVKLFKILMILTSRNETESKWANELPNRSFNDHIKKFTKTEIEGNKEYSEIVDGCKAWYSDLKNVRDDLIEHEQVGRFWGRSTYPDHFAISRFRHTEKMIKKIYELRDKYEKTFQELKGKGNFFELLDFFESNIKKLEPGDVDRVANIRKEYGCDFPDIPQLYSRMNKFFSLVNDYFVSREFRRRGGKAGKPNEND